MNGQMKSFDVNECIMKDKMASEFIESVNPYRTKPALGIDLRSLSRYVKETSKSMDMLSESEILRFKMK